MKPHDYQLEAVNSVFRYFGSNTGNPLVVMPTATGKSVVIGEFLRQVFASYPHQKILVLTHVKELVGQNCKRLKQLWPNAPAGINSAGLKQRDYYNPIIFAGIGSIAKQVHKFGKVDLIIIDEAHLVSTNETALYRKTINFLKELNPHLKVIGLSATPYRAGVGCLTEGGVFTDICFDVTKPHHFARFIAEGYLSPLIPKRMQNYLNVDGVHIRGGEFIASELQLAVDKEEITRAALKEAMEFGHDRKKWLIFAAGVEHAIHIADILTEMGISCKAVHSNLTAAERDAILKEHQDGVIQAVSNNNVLTTGYDDPEIDMIIMLRPTTSVVLWVQMLGRGTRVCYASGFNLGTLEGRLAAIAAGGKQNCLVLDFAGNTQRLGPINDPLIPGKKGRGGGTAPVKACPHCNTYVHISAPVCEYCGHEFQFAVKIKAQSGNEELMAGELPIVEEFQVDRITYSFHSGRGKPDMLRTTYYCNLRSFNEMVCVEHPEGSYPKRKAKEWWRRRTDLLALPDTVDECLEVMHKLTPSTHIRVWTNKRYPEIMSHCFDGSFFGKQEADPFNVPSVKAASKFKNSGSSEVVDFTESPEVDMDDYDDDIPF